MTEKQQEQMIKAAHKYWVDESAGYDKEDIMVDSFVEGYKQAFDLYNVVGQSEQLCEKCNREKQLQKLADQAQDLGLGYDENKIDCPYDFTSRCTMGRCDCKQKAN